VNKMIAIGSAMAATTDGIRFRSDAETSGAIVRTMTTPTATEPPKPHVDAYVTSVHRNVPPEPVQLLVEPSSKEYTSTATE